MFGGKRAMIKHKGAGNCDYINNYDKLHQCLEAIAANPGAFFVPSSEF
jgi:hypothetical protein